MRSDQFKVLVESEFPFPIAYEFRRALEFKDSPEALISLFTTSLELVAQIFVVDYLSQEQREPEIDSELGRLLHSAPAEGWWHKVLHRILAYFGSGSRSPFLHELSILSQRSLDRDLVQLIEWRNTWAHGRMASVPVALRRRVIGFIEALVSLHEYSLLLPQNGRLRDSLHVYDAVVLAGSNPVFSQIECRSDLALEAGRIHLYSRTARQILPLHPFLLHAACEQCGEKHLWMYNRPAKGKLVYGSSPSGHEHHDAEAFVSLERMLVCPQTKRLGLRHFSMPGAFSTVPRTLKAGDQVGPYRIEELIKLGGMSQIYRVIDPRDHKKYALKMLPIELGRDPLLLRRFEEEAMHLKRLQHPGIVKIHDMGEDFGDRYLVLDLAVGGSVGGQRCRDISELRTPIAEEQIIRVAKQVCDCLQYMHAQGIIHRDLKPGNLLVAEDRILLTDFGIARERGRGRYTLTGMPVGTAEYMAPEQVREEDVDFRTDIYSLGCVMYELATGRPPYRADTPLTTALHHLKARPPRIRDLNPKISEGLANIILKTLQKRPELRYQSARQLYEDLDKAEEDPAGLQVIHGIETPRDVLEKQRFEEKKRSRRVVGQAMVACVLVLAAAFAIHIGYREWRVRALVSECRAAWVQGREAWPQACAALERAYALAPGHAEVEATLEEIAWHGSLVIRSRQPGIRFDIVPDMEEGWKLDLLLSPQVISDRQRFESGERVHLAPGHYRVTASTGSKSHSFPIFLGQLTYEDNGDSWQPGARLPSSEVHPWTPSVQANGTRFRFAEEQVIEDLAVPGDVPQGYCFVPPGPHWQAETAGLEGAEEMPGPPMSNSFVVFGITRFVLLPAVLEKGFFMSTDEVSVASFAEWFERFGSNACTWRVRARALELRREALGMPLEALKKAWKPHFSGEEVAMDSLQTIEDLCAEVAKRSDPGWIQYEEKLRSSLAEQMKNDKSIPVTDVVSDLALAYARTQRATMSAEFIDWILSQLRASRERANALELALGYCRKARGPMQATELRDLALVLVRSPSRDLKIFTPQPLLYAYGGWLFYTAHFAGRTPVEAAYEWARANLAQVPEPLRGKIEELRQRLGDPYLCLYAPQPENTESLDLLRAYAQAVAATVTAIQESERARAAGREPVAIPDVPLDRTNVERWLEEMLAEERLLCSRLEDVQSRVAGAAPEALYDLELPWDLRVEFGASTGWNIPSVQQWEKACRGVDDRQYPWGNEVSLGLAVTGPARRGPLPPSTNRLGKDVSPYDIWCLGGNVSEWVYSPTHLKQTFHDFLKGGNWWNKGVYANAGCILAVRQGYRGSFAGIRVVREWSPAADDPEPAPQIRRKPEGNHQARR